MIHRNLILFSFITAIIAISFNSASATNNQSPTSSIFDEVSYTETIDLTLEVDMAALTGDMRSTAKHQAKLSFVDKNGQQQVWDTEVNLRGKFRRMNCSEVPPLKINFDKDDLRAAGLLDFNDMKLVTHCVEDEKIARKLILKEFLAYKLYNQITDESFRVQLLNITYSDTRTGNTKTQSAFLIEDTAQLRARLNAKKCKGKIGVPVEEFNRDQVNTVAMFQYMIGNLDWNLKVSQNVKMIRKNKKVLAIPYDFDFSGLVNAPYALLNSNVGQTKAQERIYLGLTENQESMQAEIDLFKKEKDALIDYIKGFKVLTSDSRREVLSYIKSFYNSIDEIQFQKQDQVSSPAIK